MPSLRPVRRALAPVAILLLALLFQLPAAANVGWVRGEIRLNLRSGAGTQYKILGVVETGDELVVLTSRESWTRVQKKDGEIGWIPAGYLDTEPPPAVRVDQAEAEAATLRAQLEELRSETSQLRETNATLSSTDSGPTRRDRVAQDRELRAACRQSLPGVDHRRADPRTGHVDRRLPPPQLDATPVLPDQALGPRLSPESAGERWPHAHTFDRQTGLPRARRGCRSWISTASTSRTSSRWA